MFLTHADLHDLTGYRLGARKAAPLLRVHRASYKITKR